MEDLAKASATAFDLLHSMLALEDERFEAFEGSMNALVKSIVDPPVTTDRTPYRNKKKPKNAGNHNESDCSERSSIASTSSVSSQMPPLMPAPSGRVPRKAAAKANMSLREPALGSKMRNNAVVKLERISTIGENNMNATNVQQPIEDKLTMATARMSIKEDDHTKMDESIILVASKITDVVVLSDDEMEGVAPEQPAVAQVVNEMPPPPPATKTRKARTKKVVKTEPTGSANSSVASSSEPSSGRSTRSKKLASEKTFPVPQLLVKKEAVEPATPVVTESQPMDEQPIVEQDAPKKGGVANVTAESVYEDAREGLSKVLSPVVVLTQLRMDSTYVQPSADATFVAPGNGPSQANETFQVEAPPASTKTCIQNETMVIERPPTRANPSINSIMTNDISDEESAAVATPPNPKPQMVRSALKNHKELFNPCVQSPLKTKVEAFERHAKDAIAPHTPASQPRTTRNTGKALIDGPGGAGGSRSLLRQPSTPKVADLYRHVKPFTPVGQHQPPGGQPSGYYSSQETSRIPSTSSSVASTNSTSKLAHLNRPASASKVGQMRDSAEDIRKGLQEQADEKKRKREEKLKQVQTMREAREKEKIDKLKKQMQEKEEKIRQEAEKKRLLKERKDRDAESKRNLEEIQRNIKIQEKKNADRAKMERELAEATRKEREHIDQQRALAEKNALQLKMKQAMASKPTFNANKYTFEMLRTDDETDDEDVNGKNHVRPKPPQWSLRGYREDRIISQSHLHLSSVDAFFSSEPSTPDLKELFPQIQDKYLKRNSSAVWNTPPRYSTMNVPRY